MKVPAVGRKERGMLRKLRVLAFALAASGCGGDEGIRVDTLEGARKAYHEGLDELESGNYVEALEYFNELSKGPAYIKYAGLGRLRQADCLFLQERYDEAIESYRTFIRQYEGNPNVAYAYFRIGQAHFEQMPGDFWMLPPSSEKDQTHVRLAYEELDRFVMAFPRSRYLDAASAMRKVCRERLYLHELYVVEFYDGRERPKAVGQRIEALIDEYPEVAATEANMDRMVGAYSEAKDHAGVVRGCEKYLSAFPNGPLASAMKQRLDRARRELKSAPPPQDGGDGA
jgi:outer membrane protein assembly factor BamD